MSDKPKLKGYCPLMKGMCVDGHVKEMGVDDDGFPVKCKWWIRMAGVDYKDEKFDRSDCKFVWDIVLEAGRGQDTLKMMSVMESLRNRVNDAAQELGKLSNHAIVLAPREGLLESFKPAQDAQIIEPAAETPMIEKKDNGPSQL